MKTTAQGIVDWVAETNDRWVSSNASTRRVEKNAGTEIYTALRYRIEATPFTLLKTIDDVVGCVDGLNVGVIATGTAGGREPVGLFCCNRFGRASAAEWELMRYPRRR